MFTKFVGSSVSDGIPDYLDTDSDNDGIPDDEEYNIANITPGSCNISGETIEWTHNDNNGSSEEVRSNGGLSTIVLSLTPLNVGAGSVPRY